MISGRPSQLRDSSVGSAVSGTSSKKAVAFFGTEVNDLKERERPAASPSSATEVAVVVEKVGQAVDGIRALSGSFNALGKSAQMMVGFSRPPLQHLLQLLRLERRIRQLSIRRMHSRTLPEQYRRKRRRGGKKKELTPVKKIVRPIQRFMDVRSPGDLKLNEVVDLLGDYRRLANALKDIGAV